MSFINIHNGDFQVTKEIIVGKNTTYHDLLNLAPKSETRDIQNGYKWIYISNIEIDHQLFHFGICFHNNRLESIHFSFYGKYDKKLTWENYNENDEMKRKVNFDKWLTKTLGETRNFEWGTINAYFDLKVGTSGICLRYR